MGQLVPDQIGEDRIGHLVTDLGIKVQVVTEGLNRGRHLVIS